MTTSSFARLIERTTSTSLVSLVVGIAATTASAAGYGSNPTSSPYPVYNDSYQANQSPDNATQPRFASARPSAEVAMKSLAAPLPDVMRLGNLQYISPDLYYDHDAGVLVITQGCPIRQLLGEAYLIKGKAFDTSVPKAKKYPRERELKLIHQVDDYQNGVIRFQGEEAYCALAQPSSAYPVVYSFSAVKQYKDYSAANELLSRRHIAELNVNGSEGVANSGSRNSSNPYFPAPLPNPDQSGQANQGISFSGLTNSVRKASQELAKVFTDTGSESSLFDETELSDNKQPPGFPLLTPYFVAKVSESQSRPKAQYVAFELVPSGGCSFEFARFGWLTVRKSKGLNQYSTQPSNWQYTLVTPNGDCTLSSEPVEISPKGMTVLYLPGTEVNSSLVAAPASTHKTKAKAKAHDKHK